MGMDIYINVVDKDGNYIKKDLYDGRDSEWFYNIIEELGEYYYVPWTYGTDLDYIPTEIKEMFDDGFRVKSVKVADLLNWYDKYRPDIDAGYIRRYDKWRWETKAIPPDQICHFRDPDMDKDWVWIENVPTRHEPIKEIIDQIDNNQVNPNDYVIIYFLN